MFIGNEINRFCERSHASSSIKIFPKGISKYIDNRNLGYIYVFVNVKGINQKSLKKQQA